jgi:hypothetical protein
VILPGYAMGAKVATRKAFGESLAAVGARSDVVALDGEVDKSTHAEEFAKASQMALEDLAMMRAVHGSTVLYPSDATSTASLVREMAERTGIVYLRTTRGAYPVLYRMRPFRSAVRRRSVPVFHSNPIAEVRVAGSKSCAGNGAEAQECIQAAEQDCDHVVSRNLPLRHACRVEVSTIRRAAQIGVLLIEVREFLGMAGLRRHGHVVAVAP